MTKCSILIFDTPAKELASISGYVGLNSMEIRLLGMALDERLSIISEVADILIESDWTIKRDRNRVVFEKNINRNDAILELEELNVYKLVKLEE